MTHGPGTAARFAFVARFIGASTQPISYARDSSPTPRPRAVVRLAAGGFLAEQLIERSVKRSQFLIIDRAIATRIDCLGCVCEMTPEFLVCYCHQSSFNQNASRACRFKSS